MEMLCNQQIYANKIRFDSRFRHRTHRIIGIDINHKMQHVPNIMPVFNSIEWANSIFCSNFFFNFVWILLEKFRWIALVTSIQYLSIFIHTVRSVISLSPNILIIFLPGGCTLSNIITIDHRCSGDIIQQLEASIHCSRWTEFFAWYCVHFSCCHKVRQFDNIFGTRFRKYAFVTHNINAILLSRKHGKSLCQCHWQ